MDWLFPPFDPEGEAPRKGLRIRRIPLRNLIPNLITLLALCVGLTAIRMAIEGRFELAVAAIVAAAVLDMLDGRVARMLKSTSRFGAELDSLADFVNFGVSPAVLLYSWALPDWPEWRPIGWIGVLLFALCSALRLARFNASMENPRPAWTANFFVGMPAPAGALILLLPIYIHYLGLFDARTAAPLILLYAGAVAVMMISRVPTFSGKALGQRIPREQVLPLFVLVVLFVACLFTYSWLTLTVGALLYIASVPVSLLRFRDLAAAAAKRRAAEGAGDAPPPPSKGQEDRPEKLH